MSDHRTLVAVVALVFAATGVLCVVTVINCNANPKKWYCHTDRVSIVDETPADVEDCDAEDFRNRETDCGFLPGRRTTKPPMPHTIRKAQQWASILSR